MNPMASAVGCAAPSVDSPIGAQCGHPMARARIERRAFRRTDRFVCANCGLIEKIVRPRNPARASYRPDGDR
jgi:hypothetical protein